MPISESMVQDIVQEVMAKMQIADAPTGKHGIFKDMNDAIEAAKKSELILSLIHISSGWKMSWIPLKRGARTRFILQKRPSRS